MTYTLCAFCPSNLKHGPRTATREIKLPMRDWQPICTVCAKQRKGNMLYIFRDLQEKTKDGAR